MAPFWPADRVSQKWAPGPGAGAWEWGGPSMHMAGGSDQRLTHLQLIKHPAWMALGLGQTKGKAWRWAARWVSEGHSWPRVVTAHTLPGCFTSGTICHEEEEEMWASHKPRYPTGQSVTAEPALFIAPMAQRGPCSGPAGQPRHHGREGP